MTNDVAVGAYGLNLIGETNENGNPFHILFADDLVKRIAAHLPGGILLVRNDHDLNRMGGPPGICKGAPQLGGRLAGSKIIGLRKLSVLLLIRITKPCRLLRIKNAVPSKKQQFCCDPDTSPGYFLRHQSGQSLSSMFEDFNIDKLLNRRSALFQFTLSGYGICAGAVARRQWTLTTKGL